MTKLTKCEDSLMFFCPGCGSYHSFRVPQWKWDGDMEKPTFSPSLLINKNIPAQRCHLFIENGKLRFLEDCFHHLAGQTIDMEEED